MTWNANPHQNLPQQDERQKQSVCSRLMQVSKSTRHGQGKNARQRMNTYKYLYVANTYGFGLLLASYYKVGVAVYLLFPITYYGEPRIRSPCCFRHFCCGSTQSHSLQTCGASTHKCHSSAPRCEKYASLHRKRWYATTLRNFRVEHAPRLLHSEREENFH